MQSSDLAKVIVNTAVQPKAVIFPTDAKLMNRARESVNRNFLAHTIGESINAIFAAAGYNFRLLLD